MKKILFSLMTFVLVAGMVGGGAFAYFSDTETSTSNTFTAGTLDIELSDGSGSGIWTMDDMKPGDTVDGTVYVHNMGNLPIKRLLMTMEIIADDENGCIEPEKEAGDSDGTDLNEIANEQWADSICGTVGPFTGEGELDGYLFIRQVKLGYGPDEGSIYWEHDWALDELIGKYCSHLCGSCAGSDCLIQVCAISQIDPAGGANDVAAVYYKFEFKENGSNQSDAQGDSVVMKLTFKAHQEPCP